MAATVMAVANQTVKAFSELDHRLPAMSSLPLLGAFPAYLAGWCMLSGAWLFFLAREKPRWPFGNALAAYLISHLGKYVPGKAMVVVIRCGRRPAQTPLRIPIVVSVHETLVAMGAAALTASMCIVALATNPEWRLAVTTRIEAPIAAFSLAAAFCFAASPLVFNRLVRFIERRHRLDHIERDHSTEWPTFLRALAASVCSWLVQGVSYFLVLVALDGDCARLATYGVATAACSLSVVLGFLSMAPGQLGVREWVMIGMVAPFVGQNGVAVFAPLVYRVITLTTEAVVGAALVIGGRR